MKYLTKDWYDLCQRTGLHFDMKAHKGAHVRDEALYLRLYNRKAKEYAKMQRELYDVDPRFMLERDGMTCVPLDKVLNGEAIGEEDTMVYHMSSEEKDRILQRIADYDARPPFDEAKCHADFAIHQEGLCKEALNRLPYELSSRIADMRVFTLGYCTKEVLSELKRLSKQNEKRVTSVLEQYRQAQQAENIPEHIRSRFGFHDCKVAELTSGKQLIMRLDTQGGFTTFNKVMFDAAQILRQDEHIAGSHWIYEELYRTNSGYEAHILFYGEGMPELIIRCGDIIVEQE
ncbi:DUF4085 family protein [Paenibacillus sp. LHD-117]|uniref:DUF4085 family protein n=1 Tax=Paenibacillus sp. LHD-117 TaxID=3071412 RepID=UPI0027E14056|nr:DUF4085 family protein [Paenibacillus sp. LHD-117]MDQ6420236.1 DUF4085 family protein [Paenibacillus sp. LHD-117]